MRLHSGEFKKGTQYICVALDVNPDDKAYVETYYYAVGDVGMAKGPHRIHISRTGVERMGNCARWEECKPVTNEDLL